MSSQLWAAFFEDDVDTFRHLLATSGQAGRAGVRGGLNNFGTSPGAVSALGTSPTLQARTRKQNQVAAISRAEVNIRDACGLTLLHHIASSAGENASAFASLLLEHPHIDLYLQDHESAWTALHRAFYFGNVSIARSILEREAENVAGSRGGVVHPAIGLIKIKDREGHGPLDLYAATITDRTLRPIINSRSRARSFSSDGEEDVERENLEASGGDELYTFGSNKNITLGFNDEDDRQFPERITLKRPQSLIERFHKEAREQQSATTDNIDVPWITKTRPIEIEQVYMAKYHTAVLTSDPESNLYMCGHGQGGRLGTGDERTRFQTVCIDNGALAGKRMTAVALGQNHTLAVSEDGQLFTWGNNKFGQLGYSPPRTTLHEEDPICTVPRQIYGPVKAKHIDGVAASRIHSVAFAGSDLYTFGKNEGQLGIVDSDARSRETQPTPRVVAASLFTAAIKSVSAIDKATICLLESHDVWIFANYGYTKVAFHLEGLLNTFFKQSFLVTSYDHAPNRITKITAGGDTVCAMSSRGEIFTLSVTRNDTSSTTSTTNPAKIRSAITQPQCIWSLKKSNMAARDVGVDADGSIILSTEEGSVWKRTKRAHMKDASTTAGEYRPKDFKFSRVPGLTRVLGVRASAYGAYAAIRKDCNVTKTQVMVDAPTLWEQVSSMSPLKVLAVQSDALLGDDVQSTMAGKATLQHTILQCLDIEGLLTDKLVDLQSDPSSKFDTVMMTSTSALQIPVHRWLLAGRSRILRRGFRDLCGTSTFTVPDLCVSEISSTGQTIVKFIGLDILTIINLVLYLYSDTFVEFWHQRDAKENAYRYRQTRLEIMKIATKLEMAGLEPAARQMIDPRPCLDTDFATAIKDPAFFHDADIVVQLEDGQIELHSALACSRCPFFEGLFVGRAAGRWLEGRTEAEQVSVDLTDVSKASMEMVIRHLYADAGAEMFDDIRASDLDDFLDIVLDVLSVANELMLDRLSQVCQSVIGKYVYARNVCWLLNAISPSSVHEFKHAALEYLCLNLEAMLQGHLLNELDEDLLLELNEVVRQNQLSCMPHAKSSHAELALHERHPDLAAKIDRGRQIKLDAIRLRARHQDAQSFKPGSVDDEHHISTATKSKRRPSQQTRPDGRPNLKSKASTKDMMFAMDEEANTSMISPSPSPAMRPTMTPRLDPAVDASLDQWYDSKGKQIKSPVLSAQRSPMNTPQYDLSASGTPRTPRSPLLGSKTPPSSGAAWSLTPLPAARTDLRNIMAQAAGPSLSTLSQSLMSTKSASPGSSSAMNVKLSQKERKKMQQQQQHQPGSPTPAVERSVSQSGSPWQTVSSQKVTSLKDVLDNQKQDTTKRPSLEVRSSTTPQLTMRQTLARTPPPPTAPVMTKKSPAQRVVGDSPQADTVPRSIRHQPRPVESSIQLTMSDIVAQQQLEKDIIREAVAKRDLHEIQAEQEFQEWWEKESRRVQEAEQQANAPAKTPRRAKIRGAKSSGRGKGKAVSTAPGPQ